MALIYLGGRHVLKGKRAAVLLVIVIWVIIGTFVPALTTPGGVKLTQTADTTSLGANLPVQEMPAVEEMTGEESDGMSIAPRGVIIKGSG